MRHVLTIAALLTLAGCSKGESGAAATPAPKGGKGAKSGMSFPVDVINVEAKQVGYEVHAPGTLEAFERVQVTARVAGVVDRVAFTEGQNVNGGDALVVIDGERFDLAVKSAQAALEKAQASQRDTEAAIARREGAADANPGLIPGEELESYKTKGLTAKADTAGAEQALRTAEVNLRDARVRAPMSGVIQTRTVETGQYVQAGYVMATLLRTEPLLLRFAVLPDDAPRLKAGMPIEFSLRESQRQYAGHITLVSGAADDTTHMVGVTAQVDADTHKYWLRPGSFCDVVVQVGATRDAAVIPTVAARPTERGFVAYVIDGEVAHEHILNLGMSTADGWVEVRSGIAAGDRVVVRGAEALSDGAHVKATTISAKDLIASGAADAGASREGGSADAPTIPASAQVPAPASSEGRRKRP
jgi:RND family efflux transporter MFP subunit